MAASVYVTRPLPEPGTTALVDAGMVVDQRTLDSAPSRDELIRHLADKQAVLCMLTEKIDDEVMDSAPMLRVISNLAVGFDNVDIDAATRRGIVVTNTPDVLTDATADLTWALILAAARRIGEGERLVRSGRWHGWSPTQLVGRPLVGTTLGIVGLGKIGSAVARRASGFGMEIVYSSRSDHPERADAVGARRVEFDELLARSDIVSLHAPFTGDNRHMIDARAFELMKSTAVLVNTARGPLVDEVALVEALRVGTIAAAGLDVFEHEPVLTDGLGDLDNVVVTPHIGSAASDTRGAMVTLCCRNILEVLAGRPPLTPVTPRNG